MCITTLIHHEIWIPWHHVHLELFGYNSCHSVHVCNCRSQSPGQSFNECMHLRVNSLFQCIFHAYFNVVFLRRHKQLLQMIVVKDRCYCLCQFLTFSFSLVHIWNTAMNPHHCKHPDIWLPRKYTWPLGGYSCLYKSPKYIFSKSSTARAGACACASASEAPSSSSAWYATSSRASNLVKIATTGTAKNINI